MAKRRRRRARRNPTRRELVTVPQQDNTGIWLGGITVGLMVGGLVWFVVAQQQTAQNSLPGTAPGSSGPGGQPSSTVSSGG